jgi:D-glycero-D-manno-heptose 1,7-bisphosphate phosphatase
MTTPAIFLDRDGVINHNPPNYVKDWSEFDFLPGTLLALKGLASLPWPLIIVTNQSVVGRGLITRDHLDRIHQQMLQSIREAGGRVDALYLCPHHPEENCDCRKPAPGLLLKAAVDLDLDLSASILVGDSLVDAIAALTVSVQPVLVCNGRAEIPASTEDERSLLQRCLILERLPAVVELLSEVHRRGMSPCDIIKVQI